jgi:hypothetical protein
VSPNFPIYNSPTIEIQIWDFQLHRTPLQEQIFSVFGQNLTVFSNAPRAGKTRPARPVCAQSAKEAKKRPAGRPNAPAHIIEWHHVWMEESTSKLKSRKSTVEKKRVETGVSKRRLRSSIRSSNRSTNYEKLIPSWPPDLAIQNRDAIFFLQVTLCLR